MNDETDFLFHIFKQFSALSFYSCCGLCSFQEKLSTFSLFFIFFFLDLNFFSSPPYDDNPASLRFQCHIYWMHTHTICVSALILFTFVFPILLFSLSLNLIWEKRSEIKKKLYFCFFIILLFCYFSFISLIVINSKAEKQQITLYNNTTHIL